MKKYLSYFLLGCILFLLGAVNRKCHAQNPIIHNQFTADPTARVFGDSIYLYPSHDILATPGQGKPGWFCMKDYHVFASANLTNWRDAGVILSQYTVPWADSSAYSMWAPDCIEKNGKYYFYFPSKERNIDGPAFTIGVAIATSPTGPFKVQNKPIKNVKGIDPNVFIDDDGQAYLYWAQDNIMGAQLKDNMLELNSPVHILKDLPEKGLKEGPFMFKKDGKYYLTYPHVAEKTERLEYAVSDNPLGPFKQTGVIMEASPNCWTNHQSILKFKGQWYLFYHSNDYSPAFDKARSACIDSLFFNANGTIQQVIPSYRGVGLTSVKDTIQIDRFSEISKNGASISFLDPNRRFKGWNLILSEPGAWVKYNHVDFNDEQVTKAKLRVKTERAGQLMLKEDSNDGQIIARIQLKKSDGYLVIETDLLRPVNGIHHVVLTEADGKPIKAAVDWLVFE